METPDDYTLFDALKASLGQRQPEKQGEVLGRCANCKHWQDNEWLTEVSAKRLCLRLCASGSAWSDDSHIYTAPDFGCTLFEEK